MPKISDQKEAKIKEAILHLLFQQAPQPLFTALISRELARDEEYMKKLLLDLEKQGFVSAVKKNHRGLDYLRRIRWRLSSQTYGAYKKINEQKTSFENKFSLD
ncbi:MAG: hypothetical protein ABH817_02575 [archaeon]